MSKKCKEFLANPTINPTSKRKIKKDGPTYKALMKECGVEDGDDRVAVCASFMTDKTVNPRTDRKIKELGPTYNALMKECKEFATKTKTMTDSEKLVNKYVPNQSLTEIRTIAKNWYKAVALKKDVVQAKFGLDRLRLLRDQIKRGFSKVSDAKVKPKQLLRLFFILYTDEIFKLFGIFIATSMTAVVLDATES